MLKKMMRIKGDKMKSNNLLGCLDISLSSIHVQLTNLYNLKTNIIKKYPNIDSVLQNSMQASLSEMEAAKFRSAISFQLVAQFLAKEEDKAKKDAEDHAFALAIPTKKKRKSKSK